MSQENVEIVKFLVAAFADRDLDAAARVLHPEVEIHPAIVGGPEGVVYRGLNGNRQFWTDVDAALSEFRIDPEEFRDLGDRILVLGRAYARAEGSGIAPSRRQGSLHCGRRESSNFKVSAASGKPSKPPGCGSRARPRFL
jgi:SnoaL-like domain